MEYRRYSPSRNDAVAGTTHTPNLRSSVLHEAFAGDQEVVSLKASKLLQILRRWRAQSRRHAVAAAVSGKSTARSISCSRVPLVSLGCVSIQLHSDDEDEENGDSSHSVNRRLHSPLTPTVQGPARALSCPKLSSPLSSCTPFSKIHFDEQMRNEEFECLQPYDASSEESTSSITNTEGSSSLKVLSKQPSTPKGYVAIYVGEERKRFLVKARMVNHPLFGVLLEKAREEFGFQQKGPLTIPCEIAFFQHIMLLVESNDPFYRTADHSTVMLHFNKMVPTTAAVMTV